MENVISILLKQLLYQLESFPQPLIETYNRCMERGEQDKPGIDALIELLITCSRKFDRVYCIIDGFDEFPARGRSKLLFCFQQISECGIKLCLTTRSHLVELVTQLESDSLEISAQYEDVKEYLAQRLERNVYLHEQLRQRIVEEISAGVDGLYILLTYNY